MIGDETEESERWYFRAITTINQISSIVAFVPIFIALFLGIKVIDYIVLVAGQIVILLGLS